MSRTLSATALEAALAQQTDVIFLTTVEIDHSSLANPLRFVNNTEDITESGNTYTAAAFEFRLPDDTEDNVPRGEIILDNVDQQIIEAVRPLQTAPDITVQVGVLNTSTMDLDVEIGPLSFKLKEFQYDAQTIRGELGFDQDFLNQNFPKYKFSPRNAQGLF